jgi:hypothetical protein
MSKELNRTETGDAIAATFKAAPGTEILIDNDEGGATAQRLHRLQHVSRGDSHILLVPQPSLTDVNDPLRWGIVKKWIVLLNGVFFAFNGAMTGPIMAAGKDCDNQLESIDLQNLIGMIPLSLFFGESLQKLSYANGATLICQGVGNLFWM